MRLYPFFLRLCLWTVLAGVLLQLFFVLRIALMIVIDPQSTTFQRSEMVRTAFNGKTSWAQEWVPYTQISDHLKRAIIASEDADFLGHSGIDWEAIKSAQKRNSAAEARTQAQQDRVQQQQKQIQERAQKRIEQLQKQGKPVSTKLQAAADGSSAPSVAPAKVVGASTISQQLAKNLLLSGERNFFRKGQEFLLTQYLELLLGKRRIFEIYLNNVEWGEGIFGAQAAAQYYFKKNASQLTPLEAARLAVMLPRPKYYEQHLNSGYLASRANTIAARMRSVEIP